MSAIPIEDLAAAVVTAFEGAQRLAGERAENEALAIAAMRGVLPDLGGNYRLALLARERRDAAAAKLEDDDGG